MKQFFLISALGLLSACSSTNPFTVLDPTIVPPEEETDTGEDTGGVITGSLTLPPGSESPSATTNIFRYEARDTETGAGYASEFEYDSVNDTFTIDNLPFDSSDSGVNRYSRDDQVASLGNNSSFAVYESDDTTTDPVSGATINQLDYRAIYQISPTTDTQIVIVRSGSFTGYGFGGWTYQRNGTVTLPTSLQASFSGDYVALRDYNGFARLDYVVGEIRIDIDWDDFNGNTTQDAIKGTVRNRRIFDTAGNDITTAYLSDLAAATNTAQTSLPTIFFDIGPNAIDANGEMTGVFRSNVRDSDGAFSTLEEGTYTGIFAGDGPNEIVGTMIGTHTYPGTTNLTVRETGGFIVTR